MKIARVNNINDVVISIQETLESPKKKMKKLNNNGKITDGIFSFLRAKAATAIVTGMMSASCSWERTARSKKGEVARKADFLGRVFFVARKIIG